MSYSFEGMSETDLLKLHASIADELKKRKVIRTNNNPVGDYAEWLVGAKLNLTLAGNSSTGYDGKDEEGIKYQIKGRRVTPKNPSRQLGIIRNLDKKHFDFLIAIIFDQDYKVIEAVLIPNALIARYARYSEHVKGHILHLSGSILQDKELKRLCDFYPST